MTTDKLKSLVLKIQDDFSWSEPNGLDDLWTKYLMYAQIHKDYFRKMSPENYVKLFFLLYSYVRTQNFQLSDRILENLFFAQLLNRTDQIKIEDCSNCDGRGSLDCDLCDGSGNDDCDTCDGTGEEECWECDGKGKIEDEDGSIIDCDTCDGDGKVECETCDGSGRVTCEECSGEGSQECDDCNGAGDIEYSDEFEYYLYFVCSWNVDFFNLCEMNEGTLEPVISIENWQKRDDILTLYEDSNYKELTENLDIDELYCMYVTDSPKLTLNSRFQPITTDNLWKVWKPYTF